MENEGEEVLSWDGVTKIKPPQLVTSEQFFSYASKDDGPWRIGCLESASV
jgi:hypothetical protein